MEIVRPILALIHVGSALVYVTGFASAKMLTAMALGEADPARRRVFFSIGDRFDFRFQILGGTLVGISGIPLTLANGYSLTQAWVLVSIVLYAIVVFIGAGIWRRRSIAVRAALDAGDDDRAHELLTERSARMLRWIEVVLVVTIVVLMVLRPG